MWLCLNNAFLSIVKKDCPPGSLLVRARRPGDIERVFGTKVEVTRSTDSDYLLRSIVPIEEVELALQRAVKQIDYENFKDSVDGPRTASRLHENVDRDERAATSKTLFHGLHRQAMKSVQIKVVRRE